MFEMLKSIIDKLRINEIVSIAFIASLLITFLPKHLADTLKVSQFREDFQIYLSVCLILTISYYLYHCLIFVKSLINTFIDKWIAIIYIRKYMSPDEMELLVKAFYDSSNFRFKSTGVINVFDGRKTLLESKKIIYVSSKVGTLHEGFPYNLKSYVLKFLNENLMNGNIKINGQDIFYQFN